MYLFLNINVIYNRYCRDIIQKRKFVVFDDIKYNIKIELYN